MTFHDADRTGRDGDFLASADVAVDEQRLLLVLTPKLSELTLGRLAIVLDAVHRLVAQRERMRRGIA